MVANDSTIARRPRARAARSIAIVLVGAAVAGSVVGLFVLGHRLAARHVPAFPSLADQPDPTLRGTIAYFDDASGCVWIVAAAGQPSKQVLCLPPLDPEEAQRLGKPVGPQLVWRDDGRLEVTMFRMTVPPGPGLRPGWQQIVDVRIGTVTDVPAADVPTTPNLSTHPTVSPAGERIATTSDRATGRVSIKLVDAAGRTRTLLDAHGPGEYTYGLLSAFWSPDWQWIAADDGRILVLTTEPKPAVRILTAGSTNVVFGGDDTRLARFAITSDDLLDVERPA